MLMAMAIARKWELQLGDVGTAFLHASLSPGMTVVVRPPVNLRRPGYIWRLEKVLYGLRQSPRLFLAEAFPGVPSRGVEPAWQGAMWSNLSCGSTSAPGPC